MSDIVNGFFKQFYPASWEDRSNYRFDSILGGMWRWKQPYEGGAVRAEAMFPRIECNDGFHFSVQGHAGSYSSPRDDFAAEYSKVEVGFPSAEESLLAEFAEDADRLTDTVYGYVPIAVIVAVIEKHGGLKGAYVYPEETSKETA